MASYSLDGPWRPGSGWPGGEAESAATVRYVATSYVPGYLNAGPTTSLMKPPTLQPKRYCLW